MAKRKAETPLHSLTIEQFKLYLAVLECKLAYYYPNEIHPSWDVKWPNDHLYDSWELRLKNECNLQIVGFPWDTGEGFAVWKILSEPRRQTSWTELLMREAP